MLRINETFGPTIQGEGRSVGKEVYFLRLADCNLHCVWCDTPYTWNWIGTPHSHPEKFDRDRERHLMSVDEVMHRFRDKKPKALVVSGGEPLMQQKELAKLFETLKCLDWWIEVETNGTLVPNEGFAAHVDQFNCSPKLSNSGDPERLRTRPEALKWFAGSTKTDFKFVVSSEADVEEIESLITRFDMKRERIFLMPLGKTRAEQALTTTLTMGLADKHGILFSPRKHVLLWDQKRGV